VKAGDTVAFTVTGPPGYDAALAYSFSSRGAGQVSGQDLLLGDVNLLAQGAISSSGAWTSTVQIPSGLSGEVFLQAALWPTTGGAMTLMNGIGLYIVPTGSGPVGIAELVLTKKYYCGSSTTNGIEFRAYIGAFKPIREATMQGPVGSLKRMLPSIFEGPTIITPSGYPYILGFDYDDEAGETNLGLFPDGAYTFTVTFADGTSTSISTTLSGGFPTSPTITSPSCGQTGVSHTPTIQFTPSGSGHYEVNVGVQVSVNNSVDIWRYSGTATSVAMPGNLLSANTPHNLNVDAYASSISAARKSASASINFTTGP